MEASKVIKWTVIALFCLFILWLGGLFVNIAFAIVGVAVTLVSVLLKLVFSKLGLALIAICLVVYIVNQRSAERRYHA